MELSSWVGGDFMGTKLAWLGLGIIFGLSKLTTIRQLELVGAIILVIGVILIVLDK